MKTHQSVHTSILHLYRTLHLRKSTTCYILRCSCFVQQCSYIFCAWQGYPAENDEDRKIFSLFHRDPVPKAPRAPADCGASSQASGSRSCSRPRSRSVARSYTASVVSTPEQQKAAVCEALSSLVRHKNLKFSSNDNIAAELSSQAMAGTFLDHNENQRVNLIVEKFGTGSIFFPLFCFINFQIIYTFLSSLILVQGLSLLQVIWDF